MYERKEAVQTAKIAEFIKCKLEEHDLDRYQGPGSRRANRDLSIQDYLKTKQRICQQCYDRHNRTDEEIYDLCLKEQEKLSLERKIYSEHEKERRNRPIESCTSDIDRYMISLPDRSYMLEKELGFNVLDEYWRGWSMDHGRNLEAIIYAIFSSRDPDVLAESGASFVYDYIKQIRDDIKTNLIKDGNRIFPNDQELTAYMIQNANDDLQIQYCKIFDLGLTKNDNRKFKIIIQYSRPKGYWIDFDVPSIHKIGSSIQGCISSSIWTEYEV